MISKKKIAHIIPTFYEGGAERLVVDLCSTISLDKENYKVYLIVFYDISENMFLQDFVNLNVEIITLNKKRGFDFKLLFRINKLLKKIKPDIVNTHVGTFNYFISSFLFKKKIKYFHTIHNDAQVECPNSKIRFIRNFLFKYSFVNPITISEKSSHSYKQVYKLNNDILIYNGRKKVTKSKLFDNVKKEFNNYRINDETKIYLNVASIGYLKNQTRLINAFNKVLNINSNIILLLIGGVREGNEEALDEIKQKTSDNIFYLGVKHNVEDYLLLSNFFILPSIMEGMPISIIEAMSAGCIPLCSPVGGIINMIEHNKNGLLSKGYEVEDIFELISISLNLTESECEKMSKQAKNQYNNNYSIEICAKKYIETYQNYLK